MNNPPPRKRILEFNNATVKQPLKKRGCRYFRQVQALLLPVFLTGCAIGPKIGPDYQRPPLPLPLDWKSQTSGKDITAEMPERRFSPGNWWEIFRDQTLNALEKQALAANQDLKSAMRRIDQAREDKRISASDFFPKVRLNPSIQRFRSSPRVLGGGLTTSGVTSETYDYSGSMTYEVDIWGRLRRDFEAAGRLHKASRSDYEAVMLTLTSDVATQYFRLREFDSRLEILRKAVKLRREALALVTDRAEKGLVSKLDLSRAKAELASAEKEIFELERMRAEAENNLAILCGLPAPDFHIPAGALNVRPPLVPPGLPSSLLERRPDLIEAEHTLAAANAAIGVSRAELLPIPEFTVTGGFRHPKSNQVFDSQSRIWSLQPGFTWDLFTGGENQAEIRKAEAIYEETAAGYRQRFLNALKEVENALANTHLLAKESRVQKRLVKAARETASLSLSRYKQGLDDYFIVVDAERQRLEAEQEAVRLLSRRLTATVTLIKALGGSWQSEES